MLVPALRVPADVLRGDRLYPMCFDWLLPAGAYAPVRCPSCGGEAPLVAGKLKLGCEACRPPPKPAVAPPSPTPARGHPPPPARKPPPPPGPPAPPPPPRSARPAPP